MFVVNLFNLSLIKFEFYCQIFLKGVYYFRIYCALDQGFFLLLQNYLQNLFIWVVFFSRYIILILYFGWILPLEWWVEFSNFLSLLMKFGYL